MCSRGYVRFTTLEARDAFLRACETRKVVIMRRHLRATAVLRPRKGYFMQLVAVRSKRSDSYYVANILIISPTAGHVFIDEGVLRPIHIRLTGCCKRTKALDRLKDQNQ